MKRIIVTLAVFACSFLSMTGAAGAATAPGASCLGDDLSTYAQFGAPGPVVQFDAGRGFGQYNAYLAQTYNGMAGPIQTHMAGLIPESYLVNSCND